MIHSLNDDERLHCFVQQRLGRDQILNEATVVVGWNIKVLVDFPSRMHFHLHEVHIQRNWPMSIIQQLLLDFPHAKF